MSNKILITGLGNPGRKYKKTRHNIGFMVIDALDKLGASSLNKKDIILLKPTTYMNNSGKTVKSVTEKNKISDLIVIHDDIDLPFGTIRISKNISSAGHKGVQSIIDELGTQDFVRIRIGIQPKSEIRSTKSETTNFVLEKFTKQEKKQLKGIIKQAIEEIKKTLVPGPVSER